MKLSERIGKEVSRLQSEITASNAAPNLDLWHKEAEYRNECGMAIAGFYQMLKMVEQLKFDPEVTG